MNLVQLEFDRELQRVLGLATEGPPTPAADGLTVEKVAEKFRELEQRWPRETLEVQICAALRKRSIEFSRRILILIRYLGDGDIPVTPDTPRTPLEAERG